MASSYQVVESTSPRRRAYYAGHAARKNTESDNSSSYGYVGPQSSRTRSAPTTRSSRTRSRAPSRKLSRDRVYTLSESDDDYDYDWLRSEREASRRTVSSNRRASENPTRPPSSPGAESPPPRAEYGYPQAGYGDPPTRYAVDPGPALYLFVPSRAGSSGTSTNDGKSSDGESVQVADSENASSGPQNHLLRGLRVLESQYTGNGVGTNHSAKLTVAPPSEPTSDAHPPLFRWIHFAQQSMDFDAFSRQALQAAGLSSNEKKALEDLIFRIKSEKVKPIQTANGGCVWHMEPAFKQFSIPPDSNHPRDEIAQKKHVSWVCLPYFVLENYSGLLASGSPKTFPIETLLQAKFSRTTRERDMQQVVRQLKGAPPGFCFHVSQLWCFVVDNSVLLTCGRMAEDDLCGELIKKSFMVTEGTSSSPKSQSKILVRYLSDVAWALPAEDCETWFAFISQFKEFYPRNLVFYLNKRLVTADQWPKIWATGMRTSQLVLDLKVGSFPPPTPSGVLLPIKKNIPDNDTENMPVHKAEPSTPQDPPSQQESSIEHGVAPATATSPGPIRSQSPKRRKVHFMLDKTESHQEIKPESTTAFAVFTCLKGVQTSGGSMVDEPTLRAFFSELDDFLQNSTANGDREAYLSCPEFSRTDAYTTLQIEGIAEALANLKSRKSPGGDYTREYEIRERRHDYTIRVDLFNTADRVFKSFFPQDIEVPTVKKFWGAVHALVQPPPSPPENDDIAGRLPAEGNYAKAQQARFALSSLQHIAAELAPLSALFTHAEASDRTEIHTPLSFMNVWMNMVIGLVCLPTDRYRLQTLMDMGTDQLLREGIQDMLESLSSKKLSERSVVLPLELVSLMSMQLLKDITPRSPGSAAMLPGIYETYSSYLDYIESDITNKPPDRNHQVRIGRLAQEVSAIRQILDLQGSIFGAMWKAMHEANKQATLPSHHLSPRPGHYHQRNVTLPGPSPPPPPPGASVSRTSPRRSATYYPTRDVLPDEEIHRHGFRELFLDDISNYWASKAVDFDELKSYAFELDEVNTTRLATNKDRQERAIYAFTIVTVIFLPLSSVASIFGINTADVRDMEVGQWAYWATAVPVTIFVIFFGLLWTGELGNVAEWFKNVARSLRVRTTSGSGGGGGARWKRLDDDDGILYRFGKGRSSGRSSAREKEDWGSEVVNIIPRPRRRNTFVSPGSRQRH